MARLSRSLILATLLGFCATEGTPAMAEAEPYARVLYEDGRPFIEANGDRVHPFAIFINTDFARADVADVYAAELTMARGAGVRLVSMIITLPWTDTGPPDFANLASWLDFIIDHHPEALIFPRIRMHNPSPRWVSQYPGDMLHFGDGSTKGLFSPASDVWLDECSHLLTAFVQFVEGDPRYAEHVCGYQLGAGETCEWFHDSYRQKGPDTSPANHSQFWRWLLREHGSPEGIAQSWHREALTRDDLDIPTTYPAKPFLEPGADQAYIDFFAYSSDIMADRILSLAAVVKRATDRRKLVIAFYGYLFSLPDPISGHQALGRVLQSPDVDVLCSPFEYGDRQLGGVGSAMTIIDSLPRHGKLWLMEDDTRTYVSGHDTGFGRVSTAEETFAVHRRNFASLAIRGAGLWWMDLESAWLNSQAIWDNVRAMIAAYERLDPRPFEPNIAFVVDDEGYRYASHGAGIMGRLVSRQRDAICRSGVQFGLYLLDDVAQRGVDGAKVYVFLNAFHLTPSQRVGIERLKQGGNVLVWHYAADFIGTDDPGAITGWTLRTVPPDATDVGMTIAADAPAPWAALPSEGLGREGPDLPRFAVVPDENTVVLGTYSGTHGEVGFAIQELPGWTSVFYGMRDLPTPLIRAPAEAFGAHVYLDTDDVLTTDGALLSIHASHPGEKRVRLPETSDVVDALTGELLATGARSHVIEMSLGETRWLRIE